jgi:hypothetical protein
MWPFAIKGLGAHALDFKGLNSKFGSSSLAHMSSH